MSKTPPDTRRGAPPGNMHAAKHGRRSRRQRFCLTLNTAGPRDRKIIERLRGLRKHLEECIEALYGEVDIVRAAIVNTCLRWEMVASVSARTLREEGDKLPANDRIALLRGIATASDSRDKALRSLGIDAKSPGDLLAEAYRTPLVPAVASGGDDDHEAAETTADAGDASHDDEGSR